MTLRKGQDAQRRRRGIKVGREDRGKETSRKGGTRRRKSRPWEETMQQVISSWSGKRKTVYLIRFGSGKENKQHDTEKKQWSGSKWVQQTSYVLFTERLKWFAIFDSRQVRKNTPDDIRERNWKPDPSYQINGAGRRDAPSHTYLDRTRKFHGRRKRSEKEFHVNTIPAFQIKWVGRRDKPRHIAGPDT